jgi:signal transduction histidine kinase
VPQDLTTQTERWLTNHSIFGQDLLFQSPSDLRPWSQSRRIELALTLNEVRSSSLELIAPESWYGREIRGLRLYQPILKAPHTPGTSRLPIQDVQGVLFASIDFQFLAQDQMAKNPQQIGFRVSTGEEGGSRFDTLADTGLLNPRAADPGRGRFRHSEPVAFYHDTLWLDLWATDLFFQMSPRRWARWSAATGILATLLGTSLLLVQGRARNQQSILLSELAATNERLRASQRDRARLSRNLHDGTIQNLYAVGLHLQHALRHLGTAQEKTIVGIEDSQRLVQDSISELREFVLSLDEDRLARQTLTLTLDEMLQRVRRITPAVIEWNIHPASDALPPWTVVHLVHVAREALSNALRHAAPTRIGLTLQPVLAAPGSPLATPWMLEIIDDGRGFDPASHPATQGHGLLNLHHRCAELGGNLTVTSQPGRGTTVRLLFQQDAPSQAPFPTPPPTA